MEGYENPMTMAKKRGALRRLFSFAVVRQIYADVKLLTSRVFLQIAVNSTIKAVFY